MGETLLEFSLALMGLLEKVKQQSPNEMPNADILLRDQFVEYVLDSTLRRELKQLVRRQSSVTLLELRKDAIRWELEGRPGGVRSRSHSVPLAHGFQYGVQGGASSSGDSSQQSEVSELREMLKNQQEQLTQLAKNVALLHESPRSARVIHNDSIVCRRCQKRGHFARECDGERVPFHSPRPDRTDIRAPEHRQPHSHQVSEN